MTARLLVSLSGVSASTLDRCAELSTELARRAVALSLLVPPDVASGGQPAAVADWVRQRDASGDALLLHGFGQCPAPAGSGIARGRALPAHEAGLRLTAGIARLERVGLATDGFAPPRWLASRGTLVALRRHGFALCAELLAVRDLRHDAVHRGRVLGFGRSERIEPWWCLAMVLGAARQARRGGLVRLAVHADDLTRSGPRQAVLDAVDIALHHGATAHGYRDLVTTPRARAA